MTPPKGARWYGNGWLPPGAITPEATSVLLALIRVHARDGCATVRNVAEAAGYGWDNPAPAHRQLRVLREAGLVSWEPRRQATLRPLVGAAFARHASVI